MLATAHKKWLQQFSFSVKFFEEMFAQLLRKILEIQFELFSDLL
jgi:hypothetical protein